MKSEFEKLEDICKNADIEIDKTNVTKDGTTLRLSFIHENNVVYTTFWDNRFSLCMPTFKLVRKAIRNDIVECDEGIAI